jgi:2-polyprenyl-6-methoxyphenol hydroxylase-like FAD-dependent oxidoreductase
METQKISIVGGGIGGVLTALFLSKIKDIHGQNRFNITIHEGKDSILEGTSKVWTRLHLGGEYPLDEETAANCVTGAFLFGQIFPKQVFSKISGIDYLVTKKSHDERSLSVEKVIEQYQKNTSLYSKYHSLLRRNSVLDESLKKFSIVTERGEFVGGIKTNELGIDYRNLNTFLKERLGKEKSIKVVTGNYVARANKHGKGYVLSDKESTETYADIVINASWENSFFLDKQIGNPSPRRAFLRALGIADISNCENKGRPTFALISESGGMYSPIDNKTALLYCPSKNISHIAEMELNESTPQTPDSWYHPLADENERKELLKKHMSHLFPHLANMEIKELVIRPTFSFDNTLERRRHFHPCTIAPNWVSIFPTNATFSVWTAIETIKLISPEAVESFDLETNPNIPEMFQL